MVAVIPFVGKVLDACKDSKVFKPTNPWVSTIMSLLAEIHGLEKVKLNITFEIEIICQNMGLKVTDLKPSLELKGRKVRARCPLTTLQCTPLILIPTNAL